MSTYCRKLRSMATIAFIYVCSIFADWEATVSPTPSKRLFKGLATACRSNKHARVHAQWLARARTPPCFALRCASSVHIPFIHLSIQIAHLHVALRCASSVHISFIYIFQYKLHTSMFRTPLCILGSYLVHTFVEYSVGLYGRNDVCTCCCETESRRLQSAPSDVLSAHWTMHGHSREARREALARVHARRGHCCQGDVAPGLCE